MASHAGKWGYSYNEEIYYGRFDSREEALAAADGEETVWTAQYREPDAPESFISGVDIIDHILEQDDYCGEWTDGTFVCTDEVKEDLDASLRRAFVEWMDRHGLRPSFGIVEFDTIQKTTPQVDQ